MNSSPDHDAPPDISTLCNNSKVRNKCLFDMIELSHKTNDKKYTHEKKNYEVTRSSKVKIHKKKRRDERKKRERERKEKNGKFNEISITIRCLFATLLPVTTAISCCCWESIFEAL